MNTITYKNYHKHLIKHESQWFGMDSEERYQQHLKTRYHDLVLHNWIDYEPFDYKFNQFGFRTPEFTDEPCLVVVGASNGMGVGIPENTTYGYLVAKELGLKCFNLCIGGTSGDTAFRIASQWVPWLKPKVVLYDISPIGRIELLREETTKPYLPMDPSLSHDLYYRRWVSHEQNAILNRQKNLLGIEHIAESNNSTLFSLDTETLPKEMYQGVARDLAHNGIKTHRCIANYILGNLQI